MPIAEAVAVIRQARRDEDVVIPSMGSAREWLARGTPHERDLVLVPSAMGHATSMGLGLALAQPTRRVIVLSGDGSLLMNLGTLVSISAAAPANLVVVVFDNGVYEVTGGQPTAGAPEGRRHNDAVDFVATARACGWTSVHRWSALDDWARGAAGALAAAGPTLIVLDVEPAPERPGPKSPGPAPERAKRFMRALA
jgi:thiamine pyrophosphate-dependent acetolactate synthase large subunit-like protein